MRAPNTRNERGRACSPSAPWPGFETAAASAIPPYLEHARGLKSGITSTSKITITSPSRPMTRSGGFTGHSTGSFDCAPRPLTMTRVDERSQQSAISNQQSEISNQKSEIPSRHRSKHSIEPEHGEIRVRSTPFEVQQLDVCRGQFRDDLRGDTLLESRLEDEVFGEVVMIGPVGL